MNEISLVSNGKTYKLTNQNNGQKYDRAVIAAGVGAAEEQVLAHYDKLGGYIQDENGNKIENGNFWLALKLTVRLGWNSAIRGKNGAARYGLTIQSLRVRKKNDYQTTGEYSVSPHFVDLSCNELRNN